MVCRAARVRRRYLSVKGARGFAAAIANATFAARGELIWGAGAGAVASDSTHFGSLSRSLCKLICEWSGQVGGEAVGVAEGERAEGGFPALDDGAFDEPAGGSAVLAGHAAFGGPFAGAFVFDVADG